MGTGRCSGDGIRSDGRIVPADGTGFAGRRPRRIRREGGGKLKQSTAIRQKIESLSEEKRILDEEAETAVADHNKCKAALEETVQRMEENTARLKEVSADYDKKSEQLGRRVRDIYINGQISYLDVLFGAHDFRIL